MNRNYEIIASFKLAASADSADALRSLLEQLRFDLQIEGVELLNKYDVQIVATDIDVTSIVDEFGNEVK